jgi:hypothetical protein
MTTRAPFAATCLTMAEPSPVAEPVTMMTESLSFMDFSFGEAVS